MPNYCDNNVHIVGPDEDIIDFFTDLQNNAVYRKDEHCFSFTDTFMPMPKIFKDTSSPIEDEAKAKQAVFEIGHSDWYSWANDDDNWGTKWGDCETDLWITEEKIAGYYQTAWGPLSIPFWEEVSKRYPTLQIAIGYREEGMAFEGAYSFYNGECVYEHSAETSPYMHEAVAKAEEFANYELASSLKSKSD